jgi:DNA-binding IclR family transcriptional regulator
MAHVDPSDRYRAPALDKGLDILELLSRQPRGLTRAEIVKAMERSPSEIYRMLERLVARDYVRRSSEGDRYELSLKMFMLAHRHPPMRRLASQATALMDVFAIETRQSCHLVIAEQGSGVVLAQAAPPDTWEFRVRIGATLDLLNTGSGLALLAFQTPERQLQTLENWRDTDRIARFRACRAHFAEVAALGYRIGESQQLHGITDISLPVFDTEGDAIAVLTCAFTQRRDKLGTTDSLEIRDRLAEIAQKLSVS